MVILIFLIQKCPSLWTKDQKNSLDEKSKFEVFWVDYFIKLNLLFMKSGDVFVYDHTYLTT